MALHAFQERPALRRVVEDSLAHLLRLIGPGGRFVYAHPFGAPDRPLMGYNMLRHCGTLWFILRAVNDLALKLPEADRQAIARAVAYAAERFARPAWIEGDTLALVTKDAVKTGGIGLALVMLSEYARAEAMPAGARRTRCLPRSAGWPVTVWRSVWGRTSCTSGFSAMARSCPSAAIITRASFFWAFS